MYISRGSIIYVMTALTFVAYIQSNSCCSYISHMGTEKPVRSVLRCNGSTGAQLLYRLGEVCLQLVTLNTFTSHVGATEYQDCFIESTIYQLRHFLLLILLCRHASNRELF